MIKWALSLERKDDPTYANQYTQYLTVNTCNTANRIKG